MTTPPQSTMCKDCMNLKTRIVRRNKVRKDDILAQQPKVLKKLRRKPEIRIFYCKVDRLKHPVYICTDEMLHKLVNKDCNQRDVCDVKIG